MGQFFIRDNYFEKKLDDGTVIHTRTRYVVEALQYYRDIFLTIAEKNVDIIDKTPPVLTATSFEDARRKIARLTDARKRAEIAYENAKKIDKIFRALEDQYNSRNNQGQNGQNEPEK